MNVTRLQELFRFVLRAEDEARVQAALTTLNNSLQQLSAQPGNPNFQTQTVSAIDVLERAVATFSSLFSPAQIEQLREVRGSESLLIGGIAQIRASITDNAMTPSAARETVANAENNRQNFLNFLDQTQNNLSNLGFAPSAPAPGSAEIGFRIPREIFDNRLDELVAELREIFWIARRFSEAATGAAEEITVGDISSTTPLIFIGLSVVAIREIAKAVDWLLEAWKKSLEIRQLRVQLKALKVSDTAVAELGEKINATINEAVEQKVQDILTRYPGDANRRNEIAVGLRMSMEALLERLERGMTIELRIGPPAAGEPANPEQERQRHAADELRAISQTLAFPPMTDEPLRELTHRAARRRDEPRPEE